jgi:hypothetical protein
VSVAIETSRYRVCDVCGEKEGVQRVRITLLGENGSGQTSTVDLCEEHRKPIVEAMSAKPKGLRKPRAVASRKEVTARRAKKKP